jgi:2-dehydro-3-deoxyphosphooctonate aldolase (KDO 8-P synthase)
MSLQYNQFKTNHFLVAGPCVIESAALLDEVAAVLKEIEHKLPFKIIFKASFDKANRTSIHSFRGPGMEKGLQMLADIKSKYGFLLLSDIHESHQAAPVADICDILQIPAFLCRQTDLLVAAAQTDKIINVKKAQFLSGQDMKHVVSKIEEAGNNKILLTERGSMYGYNNLVVDYTGILDMMQFGYPVMMDATHSVQKPGGAGGKSGGNRAYAPMLAQAAAAVGVKGFFIETHPRPDSALSDGPNMIYLNEMYALLQKLLRISEAIA